MHLRLFAHYILYKITFSPQTLLAIDFNIDFPPFSNIFFSLEFKRERNSVARLVKETHSIYLNNMIGPSLNENRKKFWSYIHNCKSEDNGIPPLRSGHKLYSTDKDMAKTLNSYFYTVFSKEKLPALFKENAQYNSISYLKISVQMVLKQLNPNKACGPDESPTRVRTGIARTIAPWLCFIFQRSYNTGSIPSDWYNALVTAVHKKDARSNPANYRPISLTCTCRL